MLAFPGGAACASSGHAQGLVVCGLTGHRTMWEKDAGAQGCTMPRDTLCKGTFHAKGTLCKKCIVQGDIVQRLHHRIVSFERFQGW